METAKERFKQSQVVVPVFFLVSGALTLIATGGAYTMIKLHQFATPCFIVGLVLFVLSIIYSLAMIFVLPHVTKFCMRLMKASAVVAPAVEEDGLNVPSEDVIAADGEGIAFGPKRRRKTMKDEFSLLTKEKKDGQSVDSRSQQSRKESSAGRLSRSSKVNFTGQSVDFSAQDESGNVERPALLHEGQENLDLTEAPTESAETTV